MPREPGVWQRICSISFNSPWQKVPRYHGDGLGRDKHRTWAWVVCIVKKLAGLHPSTLPPPSGARISIQSGLLPPPGLAHPRATRRHFPNWFLARQGRVGDGWVVASSHTWGGGSHLVVPTSTCLTGPTWRWRRAFMVWDILSSSSSSSAAAKHIEPLAQPPSGMRHPSPHPKKSTHNHHAPIP